MTAQFYAVKVGDLYFAGFTGNVLQLGGQDTAWGYREREVANDRARLVREAGAKSVRVVKAAYFRFGRP